MYYVLLFMRIHTLYYVFIISMRSTPEFPKPKKIFFFDFSTEIKTFLKKKLLGK